MPLDAIKITVKSVDIPEDWITAEEANSIATSINNKSFLNFMTSAMNAIIKTSKEGETHTSIYCCGANEEIYARAMETLEMLGYSVSRPTRSQYICIGWK